MTEDNQFADILREDIKLLSEANGTSMEEAFFARASDTITGSGEIEALEYFHHRGTPQSGIRVDGWGGDPRKSKQLTLLVIDHADDPQAPTLTGTELNSQFKRPLRFLKAALDEDWRNRLEETSPGFELADMIAARWSSVKKIRLLLLTDRRLSSRVDGRDMTEFMERAVSYSVWDVTRLERIESSALGREDIIVNFEQHGGAIPVLPAHMPDSPYEAYLAALPGPVLASIYDRWEARLLEQNVRVFLQARGNVNKGIKKTIEEDPSMFFAYNNGITATAEAVEIENRDGVPMMTRLTNLQIVNGGQTSASIHSALRDGKDLSKTFIQMKLSIVDAEKAEKIVPDISRYANSQNRIAAADFFSNHPFHVRMEEISRRLYAPAKDGNFTQSRWFYERARGQFADRRSNLTAAQRRKFDLEHPRTQLFTKTDLAKAEMTWRGRPEIVSLGAQKNFANFAHVIGKEWDKREEGFSEEWFRNAISKLIIFRRTEKIVSDAASSWYTGGLRANTVCYAISKLVHDISEKGQSIDLRLIWNNQALPEQLVDVLDQYGEAMHLHLLSPQAGGSNPTEWAKKKACVEAARVMELELRSDLSQILIGSAERRERVTEGRRDQRVVSGIQAQAAVAEMGSGEWARLRDWVRDSGMRLSHSEDGVLEAATHIRLRPLSEAQSIKAMAVLERARGEGFRPPNVR
ncbi:AIPR protein [Aquimixticola soesokkakensis]|uniref:AIPR protein n=1 Tax=Aquimixticola soesokkakensis TaxID=1519096 RepID=A0A1Y5SZG2_9RHOB|nr:AIPR family protein [Aquimixticola soesokkakensis]SLN51910.1 AIPR protein [Aquimixticola soesokkakensis]